MAPGTSYLATINVLTVRFKIHSPAEAFFKLVPMGEEAWEGPELPFPCKTWVKIRFPFAFIALVCDKVCLQSGCYQPVESLCLRITFYDVPNCLEVLFRFLAFRLIFGLSNFEIDYLGAGHIIKKL